MVAHVLVYLEDMCVHARLMSTLARTVRPTSMTVPQTPAPMEAVVPMALALSPVPVPMDTQVFEAQSSIKCFCDLFTFRYAELIHQQTSWWEARLKNLSAAFNYFRNYKIFTIFLSPQVSRFLYIFMQVGSKFS